MVQHLQLIKKNFNVNSLISFTEFYCGVVMGDNHAEPYKRLFVTSDEDVCFDIVYEL
jgi:hypothetical protein